MTTIYVEEITSDEEEDHDTSIHDNTNMSDAVVSQNNMDDRDDGHDDNDDGMITEVLYKKLKSCPIKIGGGATLTIIGRKAYVFGGCNRSGKPSSAIHSFDFDADEWRCNLPCKGDCPTARFSHTAVAWQSKLYIFGGQGFRATTTATTLSTVIDAANVKDNGEKLLSLNCMYCLDINILEWIQVRDRPSSSSSLSPVPATRNSHTCVLYRKEERIIMFGGANENNGPMNDLWSFDLTNEKYQWDQISYSGYDGEIPIAREMHSMCIDEDSNIIYVVGGRNVGGNVCQDIWTLDLDSNIWKKLDMIPSPRCAHTANILKFETRKFLTINGGWDGAGTIFHNCLAFDLEEKKWCSKLIHTSQLMSYEYQPKFGHTSDLFEDEEKLVLFGGVNAENDLGDLEVVQYDKRGSY